MAESSAADAEPAPAATATPVAQGPCRTGGIAAVVDRPGVGRALAVNGSPCVVPDGGVVLESGYRRQTTAAALGESNLVTVPEPLVRVGVAAGDEIVIAPSLDASERTGASLGTAPFTPASGMQDAGLGFKRQLRDRPWAQDALEAFVSVPTGYPGGASGFSAGIPTYLLGYSLAVPVTSTIGFTTTQNVAWSAGADVAGRMRGFLSYQPSAGFAVAIGNRAALLIQDQIAVPSAPGGGTSNRALVAVQRTLSANVVVDVEYEANVLPVSGFAQHAIGAGAAVRF